MSNGINLPPLPGALIDVETEARAYARAAVEAEQQRWKTGDGIAYPPMDGLPTHLTHSEARELILEAVYFDRSSRTVPSATLLQLFREAIAWGRTYGPVLNNEQWEQLRDEQAADFSARYGQPAASAKPVIVAHRIMRTGDYPGTAWVDGAPTPGTTGRELFSDGYVELAYSAPSGWPAQPDVQALIDYAEGRIDHVRSGVCPDDIEGHGTRDSVCPVCRALMGMRR